MEILQVGFMVFCANLLHCVPILYETQQLHNTIQGADDGFGKEGNVAINENFVVIGAQDENVNGVRGVGSINVFKKNGNVISTPASKIVPTDGKWYGRFGGCVALNDKYIATTGKNNKNRFMLYIYSLIPPHTLLQKVTIRKEVGWFECFLAMLDDNTIVVGVRSGNENRPIYVLSHKQGRWSIQHSLMPKDLVAGDVFPAHLSVNSNEIAFSVSPWSSSTGTASPRIYIYPKGEEEYKQKISFTGTPKCGEDSSVGRSFVMDNNRMVVGTRGCNNLAFIYEKVGDNWQYKALLNDSNPRRSYDRTFGLHSDAVVVSAENARYGGMTEAGEVSVFQQDKTSKKWLLKATLRPSDARENLEMGRTLTMFQNLVFSGPKIYDKVYVHDISSILH